MAEKTKAPGDQNLLTDMQDIGGVLVIGQEVVVQKGSTTEKKVAFVQGWNPGRYIILDGLKSLLMSGALFQQNSMLVRYQFLGRVYGFRSIVLAVVSDPPLVVLQWPDRVEKVDLTSEDRFPVDLEVQIASRGGSGPASSPRAGRLRDLSQGGCQVTIKPDRYAIENFVVDCQMKLGFKLPLRQEEFSFDVLVRNVRISPSAITLGLSFVEGQQETVNKLIQLVAPPLRLPK